RACREYAPGGSFIPSITYGAQGSIFPGVDDIVMDEIRKQSTVYFK
ncbi:MAG TPA: uroporphyrinogen decarboxylase (URO-D), partial [Lachnospiraceae bacterium]|nr:uroporphyrinogen decarboxylase (URO-D) [Lachnospiraceae bacterium]